jgi:hypothetical protein
MEGWLACTKELNEWRMEAMCIYCTSLHTSPNGHHPSLDYVQMCFDVAKLQFFRQGKNRSTKLAFLRLLVIGMSFSPSMNHFGYEIGIGSVVYGSVIFLRLEIV